MEGHPQKFHSVEEKVQRRDYFRMKLGRQNHQKNSEMLRPSEKLFHKTLRNDIQWMKLKSPAMQKRMALYEITENMIIEAIRHPDSIIAGYRERSVYQRKMGKYVLRVIVEVDEHKGERSYKCIQS